MIAASVYGTRSLSCTGAAAGLQYHGVDSDNSDMDTASTGGALAAAPPPHLRRGRGRLRGRRARLPRLTSRFHLQTGRYDPCERMLVSGRTTYGRSTTTCCRPSCEQYDMFRQVHPGPDRPELESSAAPSYLFNAASWKIRTRIK